MIASLMRWLHRRILRGHVHDASLGHPLFEELARSLRDGRWAEFQNVFAGLPADQRHVILSGLAETSEVDEFEALAGRDPATGSLVHGTALITHAWRARTGLAGKYVGTEAAKQFFALLNRSFDSLLAAHEAQRGDPEPPARLIRVLMGLQADRNEIYRCHERLLSTRQHHLVGGYHMIEALAPKWDGNEQEMLSFAHTQANTEERNRSLIAYAHIEAWVSMSMADADAAGQYFTRHYVRDEITRAYEADPLRTGFDYFSLIARNVYAMCFYLLEDKTRAHQELSAVGARFPSKPWCYLRAIESTAVNRAREWSGLPSLSGVRS